MQGVEGHLEGGSQMRTALVLFRIRDWCCEYREVVEASRMQLLGQRQLWIRTNRSWMIEQFGLLFHLGLSLHTLRVQNLALLDLQLFEY